ncbi:MAG: metallophosphoesterase family protein [Balneolales bacterium]
MKPSRYIAIGDIHGCNRSLNTLLRRLEAYHDRTFIFIGDYIDRGPDSRSVAESLMQFSKQVSCIFLRGNHEQMMLDARKTGDLQLWFLNGGITTLNSYEIKSIHDLPDDHLVFYSATRLWYDTPDYLFIHAGLKPELPVGVQLNDPDISKCALWQRDHLNTSVNWEKTVVFGHTPLQEPLVANQKIGIDTGCVYRTGNLGTLTAAILPEESFIQQKNLD